MAVARFTWRRSPTADRVRTPAATRHVASLARAASAELTLYHALVGLTGNNSCILTATRYLQNPLKKKRDSADHTLDMDIIAQLRLLDSQMANRLIPLGLAAILSYIVVYLFYHFGPHQSLDRQSALKKRYSPDGEKEHDRLENFLLGPNPVRR